MHVQRFANCQRAVPQAVVRRSEQLLSPSAEGWPLKGRAGAGPGALPLLLPSGAPGDRRGEALDAEGYFASSLTQVPCTQCTETISREQRRTRGRSRFPRQGQPDPLAPMPGVLLIKGFCRNESLLRLGGGEGVGGGWWGGSFQHRVGDQSCGPEQKEVQQTPIPETQQFPRQLSPPRKAW